MALTPLRASISLICKTPGGPHAPALIASGSLASWVRISAEAAGPGTVCLSITWPLAPSRSASRSKRRSTSPEGSKQFR